MFSFRAGTLARAARKEEGSMTVSLDVQEDIRRMDRDGATRADIARELHLSRNTAFGDVLTYFDHLMEHLQWENLGSVLAGGNSGIGDIEGKPEVEQAYLLGKSL
jgi:DNA-binding NarL/FixJ family response regulator